MSIPEPGQMAPDFTATTASGEVFRLSTLRGRKVVLFFYPKADTPTCTAEACSFRDGYADIQARGAVVVGISPDTVAAQAAFREKHSLPYILIADADHRGKRSVRCLGHTSGAARRWRGGDLHRRPAHNVHYQRAGRSAARLSERQGARPY
jgi:peroxiredoxin